VIALTLLLALMVIASVWTVQTRIVRAPLGLGLVSAVLTALMFEMDAPLAGAFELSVCAGLITVIVVSCVSLTRPASEQEERERQLARARRFHPAMVAIGCLGALIWIGSYQLDVAPAAASAEAVRDVLWGARRLDLLGQLVVLLAGVFGVVVLFRERQKEAPR
jgi:NADH-quinone oxidoreductase subunit J